MNLYEQCLMIRLAEQRIVEVYSTDAIQSPVHLSIGQEAAAVGICSALSNDDLLFATYRSHAFYLAKGGSLEAFFAELLGRQGGCCSGKGGSMHLAAPSVGFMGTSAIVASSLANAAGAAMATKHSGSPRVVVAVIGDGATEEGVYHEVLNFSALHQLPLIIVVENNGWAVHSSQSDRQSFSPLIHAASYGLDVFDLGKARDPYDVSAKFLNVVERVRQDRRPVWLTLEVFRAMEHVGPGFDFDSGYRNRDDYDSWLQAEWSEKQWSGRDLSDSRLRKVVREAFEWAESQPLPAPELLFTDVV